MKITRTLKISENEFYDYLEQELLSMIDQCSSNEKSASKIQKGLKYTKNEESTHARIEITILDYQRGSFYKARVKSLTDNVELSYETAVEKDGLKVIFLQEIESFNKKKRKNLFKSFSEGVYLGRMCDTLFDMEKKIIKHRG